MTGVEVMLLLLSDVLLYPFSNVCVYACMHGYVCKYVGIYVCMYVCTYMCTYVYMYVCMHACMHGYVSLRCMFLSAFSLVEAPPAQC